ncbi:Tn3 family transposase [Pseudonocardia dioxanivorans]|uniref:Tn3 family transposase n=1 Tax=Pseudonocardia dioxanivorans TaxID=240495 RepID=UPI000CD12D76|nr:Tn3 family transposase [Pseudonocardia dioxanivorans]
MARVLELDELVEHFTLLPDETALLRNKTGATRLGFALLLKFFVRAGRFPSGRSELGDEVVEFVAGQVGVSGSELGFYDWSGRTIKAHRAEVRRVLGFRECSVEDAEKFTDWLTADVAQAERRPELVREALLGRCRDERVEPPAAARIERIVAAALHRAEETLFSRIAARLSATETARVCDLVTSERDDGDTDPGVRPGVDVPAAVELEDGGTVHTRVGSAGAPGAESAGLLGLIRSEPGAVSLESMLTEIDKLTAIRRVGLPEDLFADVAPKVLAGWRGQAMVGSPSHLRAHRPAKTVTLLAALLHTRHREVTDALVDLLIATVHRIGARAERKVTEELVNAFKRVTGKENILFSIADAALAHPDDAVREVVFPAVSGGEQTLRELVHEYRTKGPVYQRTVRTTLRASYTHHYRRGLIRLLEVLEFRSSNTHRPVLDALGLIGRHAASGNRSYYPVDEPVPLHAGLGGDWEPLVWRADTRGRRRTVRMAYEIATFQALRERLRCKDIWVAGADRWRNPDADLPADFDSRRVEHYRELRKPLDPTAFVAEVRDELGAELDALETALPGLGWLEVAERASGAIRLAPLDAAPEPTGLRRLKAEVARRWGAVPLVDMLKETVLRTGCLTAVGERAGRTGISPDVLAERLVLVIYGYGTNTGLRAVAAGRHPHSEADLRYVRRRYLNLDAAREIAVAIADATFTARRATLWGAGSTTVASDSTHVAALDQNLLTQWHSRYGGRGVLIYWHVERDSMAVHSQLISCTASEVAAMVEGAVRHGTAMAVEGNYVDSHGQSEIGFGVTRLLGFELLPRIKQINRVRLYRPGPGLTDRHPRLAPAMSRPIRWDLVAQQYDQMIKYATAIRTGTASTEAILRRFTRTAAHPTYQAMLELGRAQKTIFVARYLRSRELQREINAGLNVVESWNRANSVIAYGKGGGLATNRRDEQEMIVACLRILQAALVFVNTLMLQDVLDDPAWADPLSGPDRRGLTPLFWSHVLPYGQVHLDMTARLALRT